MVSDSTKTRRLPSTPSSNQKCKTTSPLSVSSKKTNTVSIYTEEQTQQFVNVAQTKASLNKTKERVLKLDIEQQQLEIHELKVQQLEQIIEKHPDWDNQKIKLLYPNLAHLVDIMKDD